VDAATVQEQYETLVGQLNQAMLVTKHDRVPLLRRIMAHLGQPDRYFHVIHLAGTNGKGSTGAMLASVLQAQGLKIGRFSSPAINDDREQLQVNGRWISPAEFIDSYHEILPVLGNMGLQAADISIFEWEFLIGSTSPGRCVCTINPSCAGSGLAACLWQSVGCCACWIPATGRVKKALRRRYE